MPAAQASREEGDMDFKRYWEGRAHKGSWSTQRLYEGPLSPYNYNFITRREGVRQLLAADGRLPRILDVGCGTGDYFEIASLHGASYHGVDWSWKMVREAAARVDGHGKRHLFVTASGAHLPYRDHSFDLVLAVGYIEYFADPAGAIQEIARVLKPGGILVMQSFKRDLFQTLNRSGARMRAALRRLLKRRRRGGAGLPVKLYSRRGLDRLLAPAGFVPVDHRFNNHWVFPRFLMMKYPGPYIRMSERLNRLNSVLVSCLAVNYIGKYVLVVPERQDESAAAATATAA
jgi:SAM-dependent methyltransferase